MKTPILSVLDKNGNVIAIPAIRGEKGDKGAPGNHLNARGYALHARNIISHINRIIRQHPEEFRTTAFIGTDYAYTIE